MQNLTNSVELGIGQSRVPKKPTDQGSLGWRWWPWPLGENPKPGTPNFSSFCMVGNQLDDEPNHYIKNGCFTKQTNIKFWLFRVPGGGKTIQPKQHRSTLRCPNGSLNRSLTSNVTVSLCRTSQVLHHQETINIYWLSMKI